jgi:16S rRNA (guanine527-N7)-methyltransferase
MARGAFPSERWPLIVRYVELLATAGVERGLIGPREAPRLWERHVLNCAAVGEAIPPSSTVADLGSGAGLPGLVLAIARPDLDVTLVEPLLRRTVFLDEVVDELNLTNVVVHRGRAEELHGKERFDVVTARALAPLERLVGWAMPLVGRDGALLAMKGSSAAEEIIAAKKALRRFKCPVPAVIEVTAGDGISTATLVEVTTSSPRR